MLLASITAAAIIGDTQVFAHGGEDHGDEKPKTTVADKGTMTRVARLGKNEVMLKYSLLEPDTATVARLFVTKFETNEPNGEAVPAIEIESANGAITGTTIEKTNTPGSFIVKIPALPQGSYVIRAKLNNGGETDTATFSGVEVKPQTSVTTVGGMSWISSVLIVLVFAFVLAMFGGLIYFIWNFSGSKTEHNETVSV